jgi:hypothetical protein
MSVIITSTDTVDKTKNQIRVYYSYPWRKLSLPQSFQNVPIIARLYQCYASFHEVLIGFPKSERYSLEATIQQELLAMLRSCLAAAGTSDSTRKQRELERASVNLDTLRL